MESFVVSARKYRPTTFESVVGQKALTATLKNAILTHRLGHAYLFCGPRGVGKTTCARIFAKSINCFTPTQEGNPCNVCESCVSFNEQRSYNIHELDAASNNSIEDIRSIIDQVRIPPQVGKYKIFIVDEVHMLSTAAFNAFLKTLEEPPKHVVYILATTEKHKLLPTIISRCQIYDFTRIELKDIEEHLAYVATSENVKFEPAALGVIARKADGGMRDALSMLDQLISFTQGNLTYAQVIENLNVLDYEYYFKLTESFLKKDITETLLLFNEVLSKGFDGGQFITGLAAHFRDLLVGYNTSTVDLLEVGGEIKEKYITQAKNCSIPFIYKALKLCNTCDLNYRISNNKRLLVELTLIEIIQNLDDESFGHSPKKQLQPIFTQTKQTVTQTPSNSQSENNQSQQHTATSITSGVTETAKKTQVNTSSPKLKPLGIISLKKKEEEQTTSSLVTKQTYENATYTENDIIQQWHRFANELPREETAMQGRMKIYLPQLKEKDVFEIEVENELVANYFLDFKKRIENNLRAALNNGNLTLKVTVVEKETKKQRAFSPQEKFNQLHTESPAFAHLVKELGLRLT